MACSEQKFWANAERRGADQCWEWKGLTGTGGYGRIYPGRPARGSVNAHRVSWELANGQTIPKGMLVCHTCDNPPCVNPNHLWLGTYTDNNRDKTAKGRSFNQRKTHCPNGHPYEGSNLHITRAGRRQCRECDKLRKLERRRAAKCLG